MSVLFQGAMVQDLIATVSPARFDTYLRAANGDHSEAVALYLWNAKVSAAFMVPLQLCEVAIRNAAVEAIEKVHGTGWTTSTGFLRSLPRHKFGFQPSDELRSVAARHSTTGQVVADLKFVFWQYLFTKGQDARLWLPYFAASFPGYDRALSIPAARARLYGDVDAIRGFRNRIAHHEPIFSRNLVTDYERIRLVVEWRRPSIANWMDAIEDISALLSQRP